MLEKGTVNCLVREQNRKGRGDIVLYIIINVLEGKGAPFMGQTHTYPVCRGERDSVFEKGSGYVRGNLSV